MSNNYSATLEAAARKIAGQTAMDIMDELAEDVENGRLELEVPAVKAAMIEKLGGEEYLELLGFDPINFCTAVKYRQAATQAS